MLTTSTFTIHPKIQLLVMILILGQEKCLLNCTPGLLEAVAARGGPGRRRLLAPLGGEEALEPLGARQPGGRLRLGDVPAAPAEEPRRAVPVGVVQLGGQFNSFVEISTDFSTEFL